VKADEAVAGPSTPKRRPEEDSANEAWEEGDLAGMMHDVTEPEEEQSADDSGGEDTGPFETLASCGPRESVGSAGHPEGCTPCTFYCFARRGCNRSSECRFCHLAHQSKLQLRREAWKQQQRQKRKAMNEAMAAEAAARRREAARMALDFKRGAAVDGSAAACASAGPRTGGWHEGGPAATPIALFDRLVDADQGQRKGYDPSPQQAALPQQMMAHNKDILATRPVRGTGSCGSFAYSPQKAILALGQKMHFRPQLTELNGVPAQFRPASTLPQGVTLDPASGILYAEPAQAWPSTSIVVEADMLGGRTARASVEVEVIDFTRGGFNIGHLSEVEPGRFMVLLCKPDHTEEDLRLPISSYTPGGEVSRDHADEARRQVKVRRPLPPVAEEAKVAYEYWKHDLPDVTKGPPAAAGTKSASYAAVGNEPGPYATDEGAISMVLKLAKALDDPLLGTPAMPTVGSAAHHLNKCSPCAFVYKEGCSNGAKCRFCHLCERGEKRRRKKEMKGFQRTMMSQ